MLTITNKKMGLIGVFITSIAMYFGTVNAAGVPHVVSATDKIDATSIEFKEPSKAWRDEGVFPNLESIAKMQPGLTKQEVYTAFGKPHFSEGFFAVRQWDYIFKFNVGSKVELCQYQIRYGSDYKLASTFWNRSECADYAVYNKNIKVVSEPRIVEKVVEKPVDRFVEVEKQMVINRATLQGDALFGFGKSNIEDMLQGGRVQLMRLANSIKSDIRNVESVQITGHTDRIGNDDQNAQLSLARANTVRDALVAMGLSATTLTTQGMGASKPIKTCTGKLSDSLISCLQDNRRVEITIRGVTDDVNRLAKSNVGNKIATNLVKDTSQIAESVHNSNAPERNLTLKWAPILVNAKP